MKTNDSAYLKAATIVDELHVAFGTMLSVEGMLGSGAGRFFSRLKELPEIRKQIEKLIELNRGHLQCAEFSELWEESVLLFERLVKSGTSAPGIRIEPCFKYFYAASGLTYLWLSEQSQAVAERRAGGYIEENQVILATRCGLNGFQKATLSKAMKALAEMQRDALRPFWYQINGWIRDMCLFLKC